MEHRLFQDLIESDTVSHGTKKAYTMPVSIAIHTVLLAFIVIIPILTSADLPDASNALKAFLVEPQVAVAAAPPPPPAAARPANAPKVPPKPIEATNQSFVAPIEIPDEIKPDEGVDLGVEGGVAGGVEGGVAGGVVGGIVGGISEAPAPVQAVRVGGQIKEPKKIKDVPPVYPPIARSARIQGNVVVEFIITPQGRVTDIKIIRGIPLLDQAAVDACRQWIFTPTLLNGVPVPVIMTVNVNFRIS